MLKFTLNSIVKELEYNCYSLYHFLQPKAAKVSFFTLLKRSFAVVEDGIELYTCIEDDSHDFFVGCGLDDNGLYRMLPYVGVVK